MYLHVFWCQSEGFYFCDILCATRALCAYSQETSKCDVIRKLMSNLELCFLQAQSKDMF